MRSADEERTGFRRRLRHNQTDVEGRLWTRLRNRRLGGFKFVRQEGFGPYVADFCCREAKVIIELDGSQHAESTYDAVRDAYLTSLGYRVLRFWNSDINDNIVGVLDTIIAALPPSPRTRGEDVGPLVGAGVSPEGEGEGAIPEEPPQESPPHPRLPPRCADDEVGTALSPRAGRGGESP